jgi:hypothetical protein
VSAFAASRYPSRDAARPGAAETGIFRPHQPALNAMQRNAIDCTIFKGSHCIRATPPDVAQR